MAEPTNIFRGKNKEYLCLQWAELLKAVMAEYIYLFIGGTYLIFNWRKLCKSLLMEEYNLFFNRKISHSLNFPSSKPNNSNLILI